MKKIFYVGTIITALFLSACSSPKSLTYMKSDIVQDGFHRHEVESLYIDYAALSEVAVAEILKKVPLPKRVIVTDFVDITSLENNTKVGYVLSNNIKNALINNYKIDVVEAEVSKYFKISGNGLKILSRDIHKLRSTDFDVRYVVTGTYTHTDNEFIVFVKLIDLKTGIIKGSYAHTFPMGNGTQQMLETK